MPCGATSTQPVIDRPVILNSLTCGSLSASSPSSGPRRTMSESFQTPTSMLPFSRKPTPPNIFFSSTCLRRGIRWRMRSASGSLKAIGHALVASLRGSLAVTHRVFYLDAEEGPQTEAEPAWQPLVRLPVAVRRRLPVHRDRQGRGPPLPAAQRRDRLPVHP